MKKAAKLSLAVIASGMLDQYSAEDLGLSEDDFEVLLDQVQNIVDELCGNVHPAYSVKENISLAKKFYSNER